MVRDHGLDVSERLEEEWRLFQRLEGGAGGCLYLIWESDRPAVVVGRNTSIAEHVVLDACRADGVPVLRRVSGGGAVVLGPGCLNYALGVPFVSCPELAEVAGSFASILGRMAAAFALDGLVVSGGTDLALHGRKVSGNAQRRGRRALLHHGTLLYAFDPGLAARYLHEPARQPAYRARRSHADFIGNLPLPRETLEARIRALAADGFTFVSRSSARVAAARQS